MTNENVDKNTAESTTPANKQVVFVNGKKVTLTLMPEKKPSQPKPKETTHLPIEYIDLPDDDLDDIIDKLSDSYGPKGLKCAISPSDPTVTYVAVEDNEVYVVYTEAIVSTLTALFNSATAALTDVRNRTDDNMVLGTVITEINNNEEVICDLLSNEGNLIFYNYGAENDTPPVEVLPPGHQSKSYNTGYGFAELDNDWALDPDDDEDYLQDDLENCWHKGSFDFITIDTIIPRLDKKGNYTTEAYPLFDFEQVGIKEFIFAITNELNQVYTDTPNSLSPLTEKDFQDVKNRHIKLPLFLYSSILNIFHDKITPDKSAISFTPYLANDRAPWIEDDIDELANSIIEFFVPGCSEETNGEIPCGTRWDRLLEVLHRCIDSALVQAVNTNE